MNTVLGNYKEGLNISSYTLFHFTNKYEIIEKILTPQTSGLKFSRIYEKIPGTKLAYYTDSISFCDIPLSMIKNHVNWYGAYAIGLKKSVAKKLGATPVFYCHSKTVGIPHSNNKKSKEFYENCPWFTSRIKQSYGKQAFENNGEISYKNRKFYNEREWRIIASFENMELIDYQKESDLMNYLSNNPSKKQFDNVRFNIEDIEYIILEKSSDISQFMNFITQNYKKKVNEILTKVLFFDKLKNDL